MNIRQKQVETKRRVYILQRLFVRNADIEIPEQVLMLAIILHACQDLLSSGEGSASASLRSSAEKFFLIGQHVFYCDCVGLNPDWVVEVLRDYAGLPVDRVI